MHRIINAWPPEGTTEERKKRAATFKTDSLKWLENLCKPSVGKFGSPLFKARGYSKKTLITPYVHLFTSHGWWFIERFGGMKPYSMQALERVNNLQGSHCCNMGPRRQAIELLSMMFWTLRRLFNPAQQNTDAADHFCSICSVRYVRKGHLRNHLAAIHPASV